MSNITASPLGKKVSYQDTYEPSLLFPVARADKRNEIGILDNQSLPFYGHDIWTAYELSWLNHKGKPSVHMADFIFPCSSPFLIESKSFKLYLNSFNNSMFEGTEEVLEIIKKDLSKACGESINANIYPKEALSNQKIHQFSGMCLDSLDVTCQYQQIDPSLLSTKNNNIVSESLYTELLKSNCLVTGQPDWGDLEIDYTGPQLCHENLLKYVVSFRNHNEFHEQCVERIFTDLLTYAAPKQLTVYARYTRRGGLDINPIRSTENIVPPQNLRHYRQ